MDIGRILSRVDHTFLSPTATLDEIKSVIDDAIYFKAKTACIPPSYVAEAFEYAKNKLPVCTVIGFPNGYSEPEIKAAEATLAIKQGAEEIDMVINLGRLKEGRYDYILDEIKRVKAAAGEKVLKVIIETCLLTENEKIKMCEIISASGADYIKTSTGFSGGGAVFSDISLFKSHCSAKIKASGGISSLLDAEKFIDLGADRLGTSKIIRILKSQEGSGY